MYQEVIRKAHDHNVKVVIDHGRVNSGTTEEQKELIKASIKIADYYLPSKDELFTIWGGNTVREAVGNIRLVSQAIIAVKDSENGAFGDVEGNFVHVPAYDVGVKNTVGAGDSFNAGFLRAQTEGKSLEDSLRFANATAALKISQENLPTYDQVVMMINS